MDIQRNILTHCPLCHQPLKVFEQPFFTKRSGAWEEDTRRPPTVYLDHPLGEGAGPDQLPGETACPLAGHSITPETFLARVRAHAEAKDERYLMNEIELVEGHNTVRIGTEDVPVEVRDNFPWYQVIVDGGRVLEFGYAPEQEVAWSSGQAVTYPVSRALLVEAASR